MQQLTFIQEPIEDRLEKKLSSFIDLQERVIKSQYAKIGALAKTIEQMKSELALLKMEMIASNK